MIRNLDQYVVDVDSLDSRLTNLETDVTALKTDVATLKTDVARIDGNVAALTINVAALTNNVAKILSLLNPQSNTEVSVLSSATGSPDIRSAKKFRR